MLSKELEATLTTAFNSAHKKRHEFITVEHLLLALLDNASARAVIVACGCDINALHDQLAQFIDETIALIPEGKESVAHPTKTFQRVLQRAVFHVQASYKEEVTGATLFVALFSEQDSHAVYLLNKQDVSSLDVVNYLAHGISKLSQEINEPTTDSEADDNSSLYKVMLLNDDFTPMRFVIEILMKFFDMTEELATNVMLQVHTKGVGICGTFSKVVAETKVYLVNQYSRDHQHPLLCSMEEM